MLFGRTNVNTFLAMEQRRDPSLSGDFSMLFSDVVRSCKVIAQIVARGSLARLPNERGNPLPTPPQAVGTQRTLDLLANQTFLKLCGWGGHLSAMTSGELDEISQVEASVPKGKFLLVFEPLDGASNIDVNLTVGSIFAILRCPADTDVPTEADFFSARRAATRRRIRHLRPVDDAGADSRQRHARLHAGPRDR